MNLETIEQIVALVKENPVSEITWKENGQRVRVRKSLASLTSTPSSIVPVPEEAVAEPEETGPASLPEEPLLLTATMVGVFHQAAVPVSYGALIARGQVIGSIESMKVMNDVPADGAGRVVDVFVEEGAPVEYGQALFRLAPE